MFFRLKSMRPGDWWDYQLTLALIGLISGVLMWRWGNRSWGGSQIFCGICFLVQYLLSQYRLNHNRKDQKNVLGSGPRNQLLK